MNIRFFIIGKTLWDKYSVSIRLLDLNKANVGYSSTIYLKSYLWVLVCFYLILLISCKAEENNVRLPTLQPMPDYIIALSPKPFEIIPFAFYVSGESQVVGLPGIDLAGQPTICIQYNLTSLGSFSVSHATLLINKLHTTPIAGVIEESRISRCGMGFGTCRDRNLCWGAPFKVGIHEVVFQLHFKSGEVEEYIWYYEVVDSVKITPIQSND